MDWLESGRRAPRLIAVVLTFASWISIGGTALPRAPKIDVAAMALQVALDRAGVSPGVIDGQPGALTRTALAVFQEARGLVASGALDSATRKALQLDGQPATRPYTVTAEDVAGPFAASIPTDLVAQGRLAALSYTGTAEVLAERFHTEATVLQRLNPNARFVAGETLEVPSVDPMVLPAETKRRDGPGEAAARVSSVTVSRSPALVMVLDERHQLLFAAPVTSGSEHDPLPLGEWKVTDVYTLPAFHYNPALFWDADPSHARTTIKPGPNNPVGVAWIDINREHYGLHGTPEPRTIGRSASHGCVRLTNWDVMRLLTFVEPGTPVLFTDTPIDFGPPQTRDDNFTELVRRTLEVPVQGVARSELRPSFRQARGDHPHEALDIPAPRGTPVVAVERASVAKLFKSKPGGLTIYLFDESQRYAYYFAHLDRYADGLKEGGTVERGEVLGYVGSSGNADARQPHLHFAIFRLGPERRWWEGTAIDPYPIFMARPQLAASPAVP